jgi:hypothetical protein
MLVINRTHHPVAMPSTPKAPLSNHQAVRISKQSSSNDRLCQTIYDDGRTRCIVESRRRFKMGRSIDAEHIGQSYLRSTQEIKVIASPERVYPSDLLRPSSKAPASRSEGLASSRDGYSRPSSNKAKTVVIIPTSSKSTEPGFGNIGSTSQKWLELTPPPTPRLGRLPSPELSDLDEAPFCECDKIALRSYCNSCKKEFDPLLSCI